MSMQINLQHVFKMSASRTHACIGQSLAYMSDVQWHRHGVLLEFQNSAAQSCFFVEPGVKINGAYYCDMLLMQKLLPVIRQISGNEFVFQHTVLVRQLSSYVERRARLYFTGTVATTVQTLTWWITKSGLKCSSTSTRQRFEMLTNCDTSAERLEQH